MMKSHQLEQTAERGPQRPCVGMLNVQQETLQEERLWELCCRNLHADQLPQYQVLWGLMKCCCLMMTTAALGERHHSTCGSSKKKMLQVRRLHHLDLNTVYCALGRGGGEARARAIARAITMAIASARARAMPKTMAMSRASGYTTA